MSNIVDCLVVILWLEVLVARRRAEPFSVMVVIPQSPYPPGRSHADKVVAPYPHGVYWVVAFSRKLTATS